MIHFTSLKIPYLRETILIAKRNHQICRISFSSNRNRFVKLLKEQFNEDVVKSDSKLKRETAQLLEYFNGNRKEFSFNLLLQGTEFQKKVWKGIASIKYGQTLSYSQLAQRIKNKNAVRAVGTACGKNPISVVIPCHRVISNDGSLGGFGGGEALKQKMLDLEKGVV